MPYCSDCGKRTDAQVMYCPYCGGPLQFAPPQVQPVAQPGPYATYYPGAPAQHDDVDEAFLDSFSWGTGCGFYYWSSAMLMFLLGNVVLNLMSSIASIPTVPTAEGGMEPSTGQDVLVILIGAAALALAIWAGKVARRRRWTILRWRDFSHFRQDENTWGVVGIIGWFLIGLIIVFSFIGGLVQGLSKG